MINKLHTELVKAYLMAKPIVPNVELVLYVKSARDNGETPLALVDDFVGMLKYLIVNKLEKSEEYKDIFFNIVSYLNANYKLNYLAVIGGVVNGGNKH